MCQLNARCLSDDKKAVVFVLTDLWTGGREKQVITRREEQCDREAQLLWGHEWEPTIKI